MTGTPAAVMAPAATPNAAAAETSAAGLRLGGGPPVMENYDSVRKIGRGNYGTVYLARDKRNGKHYCLKQIQMETYSAEERANAQQEVEVLRTLDHPIHPPPRLNLCNMNLHLLLSHCVRNEFA